MGRQISSIRAAGDFLQALFVQSGPHRLPLELQNAPADRDRLGIAWIADADGMDAQILRLRLLDALQPFVIVSRIVAVGKQHDHGAVAAFGIGQLDGELQGRANAGAGNGGVG